MDGPVVRAVQRALEAEDVEVVLPFVHDDGEPEVRAAFEQVLKARAQGGAAQEVADRFLFETVVRIHRAGEGAPFTGLKPAGLDVGPVIPIAEAAIESGSVEDLASFLAEAVRHEATERFDAMQVAKAAAGQGVAAERAYVEAMLGLQVWSHKLYLAALAPAHGGEHHHEG
jgi:hypothetical protein